jgi:hypothetical protein
VVTDGGSAGRECQRDRADHPRRLVLDRLPDACGDAVDRPGVDYEDGGHEWQRVMDLGNRPDDAARRQGRRCHVWRG